MHIRGLFSQGFMGVCVIQNRSSAEAVPSSLCGFNAAVGAVGCALYVPFMQSH